MLLERRIRVRYLLAFWLFVLSGIAFLDRTNISIAGLQVSHEYGLGNQRLGWVLSSFLLGYAGFQLPSGWLATRYGPRLVLSLGVLWWGVATALTALLPSKIPHAVVLLIGIRFALGAGESVIYPAASQFVARWVPEKERGFTNGLIFAGVGAGSGLTPPLLTWLIARHGWRAAFWFSCVAGLVAGSVWWWAARDTPEEHPAVSAEELNEIRGGLPSKTAAEPNVEAAPRSIQWRAMFRRGDLVALMAGYSMLPFLAMTVCCLLGGVLSDRLSRAYGVTVGRCGLASFSLLLTAGFLLAGSQVESPGLAGVILAGGAGALYLAQSSFGPLPWILPEPAQAFTPAWLISVARSAGP